VLKKILSELTQIDEFIDGMSFDDFVNDEKTRRSVAYTLLNIGEKSKLLSENFVESTNWFPAKQIKATRNVAAHEYDVLRFDYIWAAVQTDFVELKSNIEKLIAD